MNVTRKTNRHASQPVYCDFGCPSQLHGRSIGVGRIKPVALRPPRSKRTLVLGGVELKRIEDALLDALLNYHVNADNALDRLVDEMNSVELKDHARSNPRGGRTEADEDLEGSKVARIEELLVAAVLDNHPNRNRALDRILDDINIVDDAEVARMDMIIDSDFDGLA